MGSAVIYGLYVSAATIVLSLIEYFTGLWSQPSAGWLGLLSVAFLLFGILFCIQDRKKNEFNGSATYGQGFASGMLVSLVAGVVAAIFMYVYASFINPELIDFIRSKAEQGMRENKMTQDQIDQAMKITKIWISVGGQVLQAFVGTILIGLILSLIIAIFTRTKDANVEIVNG